MKNYHAKLNRFLEQERDHGGWRFWLLFVVATNIGFFLGLTIAYLLFGKVNVYIGMILSGMGQSWVLSRHFPEHGEWAVASAIGWFIGGWLRSRTLAVLMPDISFAANLFLFPIIAGCVMGIPQ